MMDQNQERFKFMTCGFVWMVQPFLNIRNLERGVDFKREIKIFSLYILSLKCLWDIQAEKQQGIICASIFIICCYVHVHAYTSGVSERAPGKREKSEWKFVTALVCLGKLRVIFFA